MTNYLAFIICLNIAPVYMDACKLSIKATAIETGFQTYSDGLDRYSQVEAKRLIHRLDIPETVIAVGYTVYQFGAQNNLIIPIGNCVSNNTTIWGSRHSLGLNLEWKW